MQVFLFRQRQVLFSLVLLCAAASFAVPGAAQASILNGPFVTAHCQSADGCDFSDVVQTAQNILNLCVYALSIIIVIAVTYAGYLYLTANGNKSKVGQAHAIFQNVLYGTVLTLGGWIIVHQLLVWLGVDNSFTFLAS